MDMMVFCDGLTMHGLLILQEIQDILVGEQVIACSFILVEIVVFDLKN